MTLADRIVALDYGEIQQVGEPDELYSTPNNTFVAGFIGSPKINFLSATVTKASGKNAVVKVAGATTNEDITVYASGLAAGDSIKLGVRPEEFHFTDDVRSTDLILEGRVQSADRLGNITYAYIEAEKGSTLTVQTFINRNIKTCLLYTSPSPRD